MKIISPIDNPAELGDLAAAGADEFYGGFIPERWKKHFSLLASINQRTFEAAQIATLEELIRIVQSVHAKGRRFSLVLNSPYYTDRQLPMVLDHVDDMVEIGVDGIILADIALLRMLKGRYPQLELHASTLAHIGNSRTVLMYADNGIDRLVLPRHIPVAEMAEIVKACPGLVFDAFLLVGKCPNTEGLCTFHHSSSNRIWPCEIPYRIEASAFPVSRALETAMARQGSWSGTNRRHGCGLCAIPHLIDAGLSGLKLVGRGAPSAQKVRNVLLARDFLDIAEREPDQDHYRSRAMVAHRERFGTACSPNVCYYPEFYMSE